MGDDQEQNPQLRDLPDFNNVTAQSWCLALKQAFPVAGIQQENDSVLRIETSGVAADTAQDLVEDLYADVVSFYDQGWGIRISEPVSVFGSEHPDFLSKKLRGALRASGYEAPGNLRTRLRNLCKLGRYVSGITYYNSFALCWKPPAAKYSGRYENWAKDLRMELGALITHEYFHFVQHTLTNENKRGSKIGADGKYLLGPEWLVEGSAEFFELQYWRARQAGFRGPQIQDLQKIKRSTSISILDMKKPGTVTKVEHYRVALLAVELLAGRAGDQAIFTYWRLLGEGQSRNDAFAQAFGLSLTDFEKRFPKIGSQITYAAKFVRSID